MPNIRCVKPRKTAAAAIVAALVAVPAAAQAAGPQPGTPEYFQRDSQNMTDAYGRETGPGGQLNNPRYLPALLTKGPEDGLAQLAQQAATPTRIAITPGEWFGGWNVGNPFRYGWSGKRGLMEPVQWTNRYGALIHGHVYAPLPGAHDPYTGAELHAPYPGVVITTGSIQGSEGMYEWLAQDLAERGYLVLTYDVQGQGTSESLPHQGPIDALPFCNPFAAPDDGEQMGCPGVPAQQPSNFIFGTEDALSFFLSTPEKRYSSPHSSDVDTNSFNPFWRLFDRSPDTQTVTPGRTTRVAIIGHSLGAAAVSYVQGVDKRVEALVALDKLSSTGSFGGARGSSTPPVKPVVPALGVQSEYGFNVQPYWTANSSSFSPSPGSPDKAPDPQREEKTGFNGWRKAGVDTMLIVPRASTHLEYTDIPYALPASRYGQDLTSVYVQAWLGKYMKHDDEPALAPTAHRGVRHVRRNARHRHRGGGAARAAQAAARIPLLGTSFRYLEPVDIGKWEPVTLDRKSLLSFYFCGGYSMHEPERGPLVQSSDVAGVGGCG